MSERDMGEVRRWPPAADAAVGARLALAGGDEDFAVRLIVQARDDLLRLPCRRLGIVLTENDLTTA